MKIELKEITVSALVKNYSNKDEEGVTGFDGKLNIRPAYQREFIYKDEQRDAVLQTIQKNFPLNTMYWVKNGELFEVLDGQQRTISICEYVVGNFSVCFSPNTPQAFHNLTPAEQQQIIDYKLMIYFCEGTDKEKLDWFRIINIAGEKLSEQELRNAIYTGPWLTDAKKHFSKTGCVAYQTAQHYVKGTPIRQEYLETAIDWISNGKIEDYMATNQLAVDASKLWTYFSSVIEWTKTTFTNYRKEMKGVHFGKLYNKFKGDVFDTVAIEAEVSRLMKDEDVTKKSGIYEYVLTKDESRLHIRAFSDKQKRETYERQNGICPQCSGHFNIEDMEADHIMPWSKGGATDSKNCQMLCKKDNRTKSNK